MPLKHGAVLFIILAFAGAAGAKTPHRPRVMRMIATANSVEGVTKSGVENKPGTAAADTAVLPLGTRIRVYGPNHYLGDFLITDTGPLVKGRHIDLYMPTAHEAKLFGRRKVKVEVLEWGKGAESARGRAEANSPAPR